MKDLSTLMKLFGTTLSNNSPVILTTMGATGLVATAVLAAKGGMDARWMLIDREGAYSEMLPRERLWEQTKDTWKHYIPAVTVGLSSLACIIGAHNIHTRRQAAIMGLYSVTDKAYREYQEKVKEQIGENKERAVRDAIDKDRAEKITAGDTVIFAGKGNHLVYDSFSGRTFMSDLEIVKRAENTVNEEIIHNNYASLNDLYRAIGVPTTAYGDEVGWTTDRMLQLNFSSQLTEDGTPCAVINYRAEPMHGYTNSF